MTRPLGRSQRPDDRSTWQRVSLLTRLWRVGHSVSVTGTLRRAATVLLALSVGTAGVIECAGWVASSEARMICCASGECPMHRLPEHAGAHHAMTQAQADGCCALSQGDRSTPRVPVGSFATALVGGLVAAREPLAVPSVSRDAWRAHLPLPGGRVPRHVLLSVFLI